MFKYYVVFILIFMKSKLFTFAFYLFTMKSKKVNHIKYKMGIPEKKPYNKFLVWIPFVFAFILYGNSIPNEHTLDDLPQIVNNKYVNQGFAGIPVLASTNYWSSSGQNLGYYRPLSLITFAVENEIAGNDPSVSHIINILLYALTGMILFLFLSKLFRNMPVFVMSVTLLFLAHPVHTEVVANIKSRDEILSFFNAILCLLFVFKYSKDKKFICLLLSWVFYYLALLSKETSMTTLILVPIMLYFFTPKSGNNIAGITLTFIAVSGLFLLQKYMLIGTLSGQPPLDTNIYPYKDFATRLPTAVYIFGMYLYRVIFPFQLLYDYSYNQIPGVSWLNIRVIISLLCGIFLAYLALKNFKRKNVISFSIFFFVITLSVGLAFVILRGGIMAERFLYAPVLGFTLFLCYYLFKLLPRARKSKRIIWDFHTKNVKIVTGVIIILLIFYSVRTITRNPVWKNNFTLFSSDVRHGGNSALLRKHYGSELINQSVAATDKTAKDSLMKSGINQLNKALEINPKFSEAYFKLGYAYYQKHDYETAINFYKKSNQNVSMNVSNMALAYYMFRDYPSAVRYLKKALQLNPENNTARQYLPIAEKALQREMQKLQKEESTDPDQYYKLGNMFSDQGKFEDAIENYDKALTLNPDFTSALLNMGNCYYMLKNYDKSIETFKRVVSIEPQNKIAIKSLSHLYGLLGNTEMKLLYDHKAHELEK